MNKLSRRFTQEPCPVCDAPVGKGCSFGQKLATSTAFYHRERIDLVDRKHGINVRFLPVKEKRVKNPSMSSKCNSEKCDECSGVVRKNHGIKLACSCKCHKFKQINNLGVI